MPLRDYEAWIGQYGWSLVPSKVGDAKLLNASGKLVVLFIKITHPGKREVPLYSIKKTKQALQAAGLE